MSKIPFAISPRLQPIIEKIGSEESGFIEIERRGYLTSGEKAFVQQIQQQDLGTLRLVALSRRIAKEKNVSLEKAYNAVMDVLQGKNNNNKFTIAVEIEYVDEIQEIVSQLVSSRTREEMVHAACLAMHRISTDITFEDIRELHPDIIDGLARLYQDEDNKSIDRLIKATSAEGNTEDQVQSIDLDEIEKKQEEISQP